MRFRFADIITGRNEVVAKVIFLQVSVCPQGGVLSPGGVVCGGVVGGCGVSDPQFFLIYFFFFFDFFDFFLGFFLDFDFDFFGDPSPPEADSGIRSTSCRYPSYWNAFLLVLLFLNDTT